jgi:hypothetical protein
MRVIREDDACYYVDRGEGEPMAIAKAALDKATHERIRMFGGGMVEPQRFAEGGEVQPAGWFDPVNNPAHREIAERAEANLAARRAEDEAAAAALAAMDAPAPMDPAVAARVGSSSASTAEPFTPDPPRTPTDAQQARAFDAEIGYLPELGRFVGRHVAAEVAGIPSMVAPAISDAELARAAGQEIRDTANSALDTLGERFKAAFPIGAAMGGGSQPPPANAPPTVPVAAASATETAGLPVGEVDPLLKSLSSTRQLTPRIPGGTAPQPYRESGDLARGIEEQRAALAAQAKIAREKAASEAALEQTYAEQAKAAQASFEADRAAIRERSDALQKAVITDQVDPRRFWSNLDDGQRAGAMISIILGGIGAGLRGGPNQALGIIEKAIDGDIRRQEQAIAQKRADRESLLAYYVQQGKELRDAYGLAKADLLDTTAAQLRASAAKFGGLKTAAIADQAAGELTVKATQLRDESLGNHYTNQLRIAQADAARASAALERARIGATFREQQTAQVGNAVEAALLSGREVGADLLPFASKETREALVQVSPGRFARARDAKAAADVAKVVTDSAELLDAVRQMRELRKKDGRAWLPGTGEAAHAQGLARRADLAVKEIGHLGTLDNGAVTFLAGMVKDPSAVFTTDASVNASLDSLESWAQTRLAAVKNANLFRAPTSNLTPRRPGE